MTVFTKESVLLGYDRHLARVFQSSSLIIIKCDAKESQPSTGAFIYTINSSLSSIFAVRSINFTTAVNKYAVTQLAHVSGCETLQLSLI